MEGLILTTIQKIIGASVSGFMLLLSVYVVYLNRQLNDYRREWRSELKRVEEKMESLERETMPREVLEEKFHSVKTSLKGIEKGLETIQNEISRIKT